MAGRRRPESFWRGLVAEWREAGIPLARFAKSRGVAPNSLAYWVDRGASPIRLLHVDVRGAVAEVPAAHMELLVRGAVLRLSTDVAAAWVAELIRHAGEA